MNDKIIKYIEYLIGFCMLFIVIYVLLSSICDAFWYYSFSYAIKNGEIPYIDFNIITPPLYAFLMSIGLFIKDSYFVFIIENVLLCSFSIYFFDKLLGNKKYIFYGISLILFAHLCMTYNYLAYFFIIVIMYFENKDDFKLFGMIDKNVIIGLFIGLVLLSKHTIGICILVCSLISYRNKKVLINKLIGFLFVCFIFLIYLLLSNSFFQFINFTILGLFDFSNKNNNYISIGCLIWFLLFAYIIYNIFRDKNNKNYYYALGSLSFSIPIFDYFHLCYIVLIIFLCKLISIKDLNKNMYNLSKLFCFLVCISISILSYLYFLNFVFLDIPKYESMLVPKGEKTLIRRLNSEFKKEKDNIIIAVTYAPILNTSNNRKIDYFNVINYGNLGYDGTNMMINKIKNMHNKTFILNDNLIYNKSEIDQTNDDIVKYIVDNTKKIKNIGNFGFYYKE